MDGVAVTLVTVKLGLLETQVTESTVAVGQDTAGDLPSVTESPIWMPATTSEGAVQAKEVADEVLGVPAEDVQE